MLDIRWRSDGRGGTVLEDGDLLGFVALQDWYEPEQREARTAWTVQFMVPGVASMQRALLELDGEPTTEETRVAELGTKAKSVIEEGVPPTPSPFGYAPTGLGSNAEVRELIQLTGFALDAAAGRIMAAAQDQREHDACAPHAYPQLNHMTAPIRAAARRVNDPERVNLWADQAHELAVSEPAEKLVRELWHQAAEALQRTSRRCPGPDSGP
jgi:hypothetical protein